MKPPPPRTPFPKPAADFLYAAGFRWDFSMLTGPLWRDEKTGLFVMVVYADAPQAVWFVGFPIGQPGKVGVRMYADFDQVVDFVLIDALMTHGSP